MNKFPLLSLIEIKLTKEDFIDDFDRIKKVYPNLEVFELNYQWDPKIDNSITPVIEHEWGTLNRRLGQTYVSNARKILSIGGGGNSPTLDYLSRSLEYLCVLNPSERDLKMWSMKEPLDNRILLVRGVGELIPFKNASFDLVEIPSTLDHCFDQKKVLEECFRVLEQNGKVAITGGNNQSWYRKLVAYLKIPFNDVHDHHHTMHLEPRILKSLLVSVGFWDVEIKTNYFLKLPKIIERHFRHKKMLEVYGFVSNVLMPKILGQNNGGMLLVSATKRLL